ncbi:hypothetical protein LXL04_020370 [Taraxacum kok-saghyz]
MPKKLNSHGRKTRNGAHFDTRNATGLNTGDTHVIRTEVAETALQGRWKVVDGMDTEGQGGFGPVFKVRSFPYTRMGTYLTSWLIPVFVIVNIAVFVVLMYVNDCPKHNRSRTYGKCVARFLGRFSFQPLRENPLFGASSNTLEKLGALQWQKIVHGNQGWRLVTANWLHAGLIHLVANMLSLVLIGIRLEQQFGFLRVGLIYLLSGFGGSILSSLFIQNNISVGAGNISTFSVKLSDFPSSSPIQSQKSKSSWAVSRFRSFGSIVLYGSTLNRHLSADFSTIASPKLAASFPIAPVFRFSRCKHKLEMQEEVKDESDVSIIAQYLDSVFRFSRCKHNCSDEENQIEIRVCGNSHGLIRKYGLMCCRQCFHSNAKEIGFIKDYKNAVLQFAQDAISG